MHDIYDMFNEFNLDIALLESDVNAKIDRYLSKNYLYYTVEETENEGKNLITEATEFIRKIIEKVKEFFKNLIGKITKKIIDAKEFLTDRVEIENALVDIKNVNGTFTIFDRVKFINTYEKFRKEVINTYKSDIPVDEKVEKFTDLLKEYDLDDVDSFFLQISIKDSLNRYDDIVNNTDKDLSTFSDKCTETVDDLKSILIKIEDASNLSKYKKMLTKFVAVNNEFASTYIENSFKSLNIIKKILPTSHKEIEAIRRKRNMDLLKNKYDYDGKTINVRGKRVPIKLYDPKDNYTAADSLEGVLYLSDEFFLCDKVNEADAILQHEIAHGSIQALANHSLANEEFLPKSKALQFVDKLCIYAGAKNIPSAILDDIKYEVSLKYAKDVKGLTKREISNIVKHKLDKYSRGGHSNPLEFEADLYASQHSKNKNDIINAVDKLYKPRHKYHLKGYNKALDYASKKGPNAGANKKLIDAARQTVKYMKQASEDDANSRREALKDKSITDDMKKIYKENYYDDIKLEIYEAYDNGEISYNEKEYLLEKVNEVYYEGIKDIFTINKARELFNKINKDNKDDKDNNKTDDPTVNKMKKQLEELKKRNEHINKVNDKSAKYLGTVNKRYGINTV